MMQRPRRKRLNYAKYGVMFVAPFVIALIVFQLLPLAQTVGLSFCENYTDTLTNTEVGPTFNGLENYRAVLQSRRGVWFDTSAVQSLGNTFVMWMMNFIPQLGLALLLAVWFTDVRVKLRFQGAYKMMTFMPNIITAASIALLFNSLFSYPNGPINQLLLSLNLLGEPFNFIDDKWSVRWIIAFINFWMWYGNTMIVLTAGILGISPTLFEAAGVDGASSRQTFRYVTLPLLKPIMLYTLVTSLAGGMQGYDIPKLFTKYGNGDPNYTSRTIAMYIRELAFTGSFQLGRASAVSMILFVVTAILAAIMFFIMRDKDEPRELRSVHLRRRAS